MSRDWETLGLLIKHVQHRNLRLLEDKLLPLGISMVQWNALRTIDRYPDVCMSRLAKLTFNSDQAFGTLANRLLRLGLIERRPGTGRISLHRLTPKGVELLQAGRPLVQEVLTGSFAPLTREEHATLTRLMTKLTDDDYPHDP